MFCFSNYRSGGALKKRKETKEFRNQSTLQRKKANALAEQLRQALEVCCVGGVKRTILSIVLHRMERRG